MNIMSVKPLVYCASPLGFSDAGRAFLGAIIEPAFRDAGIAMVDPWILTDPGRIQAVMDMPVGMERLNAFRDLNQVIAANNAEGIRRSQGLFAVLDGVDVDSGTAAEIGYAASLNLPMVGYRGDFRLSSDNEGGIVNLQVEYFLRSSGDNQGRIVRHAGEISPALDRLRDRILA